MHAHPDADGDGAPEVVAGAQQLAGDVDRLLFVLNADSRVPGGVPLDPILDGLLLHAQRIVVAPGPPVSGRSTHRIGMRLLP